MDDALISWGVSRWNDEVKSRPMQNVYRSVLDCTWRQVIRHAGGDDVALLGPNHGDLEARNKEPNFCEACAMASAVCDCVYPKHIYLAD